MTFHDLPFDERRRLVGEGTEHFRSYAADLTKADLDGPSLLDGWSRHMLIAHLGYNAVGLRRLCNGEPMYASAEARAEEIAQSVDLETPDLYHLFDSEAGHLDARWQELPPAARSVMVKTMQGRTVPTEATLWMRIREVWIHAVDLGTGASFEALPEIVQQTLFDEVIEVWRTSGEVTVDVRPAAAITVTVDGNSARGTMSALLSWMTGRGSGEVSPADVRPAPAWL